MDQDLEELRYSIHDTVDRAHGRIDERSYFGTKVPHTFALRKEWPSMRTVGYAVRYTTHADGTQTEQVRYYILSDEMSASRFAEIVRDHWQIEAMDWVLDVTFREDQTRSADRSLASNLSWLRRFAPTMLRRHPFKGQLHREDAILHVQHQLPFGNPCAPVTCSCAGLGSTSTPFERGIRLFRDSVAHG
ncbi:MAG: ISAs1 family transposase [Planctomycetaceae bacterium]